MITYGFDSDPEAVSLSAWSLGDFSLADVEQIGVLFEECCEVDSVSNTKWRSPGLFLVL